MTETLAKAALGSRELFPALEPRAYLAHAAISPLSAPVVSAMSELAAGYAARGVGIFGETMAIRQSLRERLARLIGADPAHLGFVQNTGAGLAAVATALRLHHSERIGVFSGEYPSNVSVFQQVAQRSGAHVHFFAAQDFESNSLAALNALEGELQRGMRLLAVSAVQFQSGLRMPVAAIGTLCRRYGTLLCVDAVQALGAVPLDVAEDQIDALACGGHKWLMGAEGVGLVYIHPRLMAQLEPLLVGSMSHAGAMEMLSGESDSLRYDRPLLDNPQVFEGGMLSAVSTAALNASVRLIEHIGVSTIYGHVQSYHDALEPELVMRGLVSRRPRQKDQRSATLSFAPPQGIHAGRLARALAERGVVCSSPDGLVRFAPHWPNHLDEVPEVVAAVDASLSALRAG